MLDRIDRTLASHERALSLRAARSEILAANIANADTPNYKARDFDFAKVFAGTLARPALGLARTDTHHLASGAPREAPAWVQYRNPVQPSIDGNTVELDAEVGRFSENAMRYQASLTFTTMKIRGLFSAIQGQ